ncbi:MAG: ATP-binding cassette domain-containing protein [Tissierellia bacterium]|nr:ATP-binding cassette domain-containing protein [Tissierellia bacterium]
MLSIQNLSYGYSKKEKVLHNLAFDLEEGVTLLIGENGSGKSTLMKILTGSIPTKNKIFMDGKELDDGLRRKKFSYLPQEFSIYPSLKVKDVLEFVARAKGISQGNCKDEIQRVARRTNVERFLNKKFKDCSLGTQRRIGIATALIGNPEVVILDEPTAGVDPKERTRFYEIIGELFEGKIVLISTHILDDMDILANQVLMLSNGRMTFDGSFRHFRHSLDGHLYEWVGEEMTPEEEALFRQAVVVKSKNTVEGRIRRFAIGENLPVPTSFREVTPTLEDLWEYYLKVHHG